MSYLQLSIDSLSFTITKAHIKESLESLWRIECEGYIESLEEHPFTLDFFNSSRKDQENTFNSFPHKESTLNFHPNALINKQATFKISNPYPQSHSTSHTLDFINNALPSTLIKYFLIPTSSPFLLPSLYEASYLSCPLS